MYRYKLMWRWLKRTFTGYTVTIITPRDAYFIVHRPFKSPAIQRERMPKEIRGKKYEAIIIEEKVVASNQDL